ncbi:uncharacterized protein N7479_002438 [Penicillium vulpinum]|uniref:WSC domain-containing protein n=1 Tax=Penicillium vulpinum TaxID=29845 RepID=A0A1V6RFH1_9EURO|nr:uncharacterized protein N7479_002438 [Penicillium vulpinum]KAJ5972520.1 hypothetical protein N7479_002438 [Penicillium vulpinum]OQE00274.1 hypothetical protein PENVUL_c055G09738 [Penicillium vulpinum]
MRFSTLFLFGASLASAQYAHRQLAPEELERINGGANIDQSQKQGQNSNHNRVGNYDENEDYKKPASSPHTPIHAPAPGYGYNYPGPAVSRRLAARRNVPIHQARTPDQAPGSASQHQSRDQYPRRHHTDSLLSPDVDDVSGGIAPINPLSPGSQVAPPPLIGRPSFGKDEGNTFCVGQCFADESDANCGKPYAEAVYKPAKECYMCCFTSSDF